MSHIGYILAINVLTNVKLAPTCLYNFEFKREHRHRIVAGLSLFFLLKAMLLPGRYCSHLKFFPC